MKARYRRGALLGFAFVMFAIASTLVVKALDSSVALFITPTELAQGKERRDSLFRLGGLVKDGSLVRDGMNVSFVVTDTAQEVGVTYTGILPDLFREGKGVVAQGRIGADGKFHAVEVLAKHDENYTPREVTHSIEQAKAAQETLAP